ncbi:MAG: type II toxin-antitoxin system RelE/ParE family toxin [Olegusella sp.]|nr:type II toxin-antitoxin system RelE/ParE family toxin [Olegusella sp.]
MSWSIKLTGTASEAYLAIPDTRIRKVDDALDAIAIMPEIGRIYDPVYEAARPPFEVRVVYASVYGIYYTVDEESGVVFIRYIEDQRMDPAGRSQGRHT